MKREIEDLDNGSWGVVENNKFIYYREGEYTAVYFYQDGNTTTYEFTYNKNNLILTKRLNGEEIK